MRSTVPENTTFLDKKIVSTRLKVPHSGLGVACPRTMAVYKTMPKRVKFVICGAARQ